MKGESFRGDGPIRKIPVDAPEFEVRMLTQRTEVLAAVVAACDRRSELVQVISDSADEEEAHARIMQLLGVTATGASQVLATQVWRFTLKARESLRREFDETQERLQQSARQLDSRS